MAATEMAEEPLVGSSCSFSGDGGKLEGKPNVNGDEEDK